MCPTRKLLTTDHTNAVVSSCDQLKDILVKRRTISTIILLRAGCTEIGRIYEVSTLATKSNILSSNHRHGSFGIPDFAKMPTIRCKISFLRCSLIHALFARAAISAVNFVPVGVAIEARCSIPTWCEVQKIPNKIVI